MKTTNRIAGLGTLTIHTSATGLRRSAGLKLTMDVSRRTGHASSRLGADVTDAAWREAKREIAALATEHGVDRIEVYAQARAGKQGVSAWQVGEIDAVS